MRIAMCPRPTLSALTLAGSLEVKSEKNDELLPLDEPRLDEAPTGVDRRAFMMRSAVVGAVAVLTGCAPAPAAARRLAQAPPQPAAARSVARPRRRQEVQGAGDDDDRRVLQGRARAVELAHDRADAHHLRLLPALHQAAARTSSRKATALKVHLFGSLSATGKGHGTERAALAGIIGKEPATVEPAFLDEPGRQTRPDLPGEARRQDVQRLAEGHHLRRAEGRLPAPQHDDLQADGRRHGAARAGVLLGRRRLHRVEGLPAAEEGAAEVSVLDDEGTAGARGEEQALDRAGRDGQRGGGLRQERGGDQRLHRQDHRRDGQHRQGRPARRRRARCPGRSS